MPIAHATNPTVIQAFLRLKLNLLIINATSGSAIDIVEVHAANNIKIKNNNPNQYPPPILAKAIGNVWNINPGPEVGARL